MAAVLLTWAPAWTKGLAEAAMVAAVPVAVGIGVLRAGLFDIAAVLERTIVYAVMTGIVLATYFGTLALATGVLGAEARRGTSLLASAAVAVFLAPVKAWLHRVVERRSASAHLASAVGKVTVNSSGPRSLLVWSSPAEPSLSMLALTVKVLTSSGTLMNI